LWQALTLLALTAARQVQIDAQPWSPAAITKAAADDVAALPKDAAYHVRYLDIGWLEPARRPDLIQVLSGHVNGLSRRINLRPPKIVKGTLGGLLRLDIRDYGWDRKVWERLVSPYNHVRTTVDWPGGVWPGDGLNYAPASFRWNRPLIAPWQGPDAVRLAGLTQSQAPIVNGLWLLWQTAVQEGRGTTGYYDFLQIKTQADFEKLIRFDGKLTTDLLKRRVVIWSGVTQEPRRVELDLTVLGLYLKTFDNNVAQGDRNPLAMLNGRFKFDATEQFSPLPNRLPVWWLANGQLKRQDKAPDSIVKGDRTSHKDGRLHVNLSCWRCHAESKADRGILSLDHAAKIDKIVGIVRSDKDYERVDELQAQYLTEVKGLLEQGRMNYATAVKEASGLDPEDYAAGLSEWYRYYDEARVDAVWAARDLATTPAKLKAALAAYPWPERLAGHASVLSEIAGGGAIPIRQWEEVVESAWLAVGVKR
jgi:hypothetical protein